MFGLQGYLKSVRSTNDDIFKRISKKIDNKEIKRKMKLTSFYNYIRLELMVIRFFIN